MILELIAGTSAVGAIGAAILWRRRAKAQFKVARITYLPTPHTNRITEIADGSISTTQLMQPGAITRVKDPSAFYPLPRPTATEVLTKQQIAAAHQCLLEEHYRNALLGAYESKLPHYCTTGPLHTVERS